MHTPIVLTINDLPAYANISGWDMSNVRSDFPRAFLKNMFMLFR